MKCAHDAVSLSLPLLRNHITFPDALMWKERFHISADQVEDNLAIIYHVFPHALLPPVLLSSMQMTCMSVCLWLAVYSLPVSLCVCAGNHWNRVHLCCIVPPGMATAPQYHEADTPASTALWHVEWTQWCFHVESALFAEKKALKDILLTWIVLICQQWLCVAFVFVYCIRWHKP